MKRKLYTPQEVTEFILQGKKLVLSADKKILDSLPKGNWIAGTIPYFMDTEGGIKTKDKIFVDDFSDLAEDFKITTYNSSTIENIASDGFTNGFTVLIIPASSQTLINFSLNAFSYNSIFNNPIIGFVSGLDLDNIETDIAFSYSGLNLKKSNSEATAIHIKLPIYKIASVEIINIFKPSETSPKIIFPQTSFKQKNCIIDGVETNFVDYINKNNIDIKFPLIENQNGALINKSFMKIDDKTKEVEFYAPIFKDTEYVFSKKLENYAKEFNSVSIKVDHTIKYSCNCILNYLYGELEGEKIQLSGATTFGEIAYQLLNQTQIFLKINDI